MKKMIASLTMMVNLLLQQSNAQVNLVPNPSFEDTIGCPTGVGDFSVTGWISPTLSTPDVFHSCNVSNVGVPQNVFGFQNARTGNAYSGIYLSDFSTSEYREYIQCELVSTLEAGKFYAVRFYVSRTDSSTKACDNIGAYLSSTAITGSNNQNLPCSPQVVSSSSNPITDAVNWVQIIDTITAVGDEHFLTLGVFSNNANTNWIATSGGWEDVAHYYVDDVSIIEVLPESGIGSSEFMISLFPNPAFGNVTVNSNRTITSCSIYSTLGQVIFNSAPQSTNFDLDFSTLSGGVYYLNLQGDEKIVTKKIVVYH